MSSRCLIINRGEIAIRAIQACRELGITSVWLTTENEKTLEPGLWANEVFAVEDRDGQSVYNQLDVIEAALNATQANLVYPGYGFLSEKPELAALCEKLGAKFIGPNATALENLASKGKAQQLARQAGIGTLRIEQTDLNLTQDTFLIKASNGGGGRGHVLFTPEKDAGKAQSKFDDLLAETRTLAERLFQSNQVHFERYLGRARHIEAQFARDVRGNCQLLGTRDCSVQRKFQKVIEEGEVQPQMKAEIAQVFPLFAKLLAQFNYVGLGTIEFLWDLPTLKLYFIEFNCRIQVEHPVTEMVTGRNLVVDQFRIFTDTHFIVSAPAGETRGHAIECRLYAEDPQQDFLPSVKRVDFLKVSPSAFTRWDWSLVQGEKILPHYDPMIGKLIVWGETRSEAIARCRLALQSLILHGPATNQELLLAILASPTFQQDQHTTAWLGETLTELNAKSTRAATLKAEAQLSQATGTSSQESWKQQHRQRDLK